MPALRRSFLPAPWLAAATLSLLSLGAARADVVAYREVFPNDGNANPLQSALDQGWQGVRGGGTTNELQIFGPPGGSTELPPVNSNPNYGINPPSPTGYAFWSPRTHDVTIYTGEFSLPSQSITHITFDVRHSGQSPATFDLDRLALHVNGKWYISSAYETYTGAGSAWQTDDFAVQGALFAVGASNPGDPANAGPRDPGFGGNPTLVPLPAGTVDAFGIFSPGNDLSGQNHDILGNHRYDDYTIFAVNPPPAVPEPTSLAAWAVLAGFGAVARFVRRRRAGAAAR